jgi:hypothetical protein
MIFNIRMMISKIVLWFVMLNLCAVNFAVVAQSSDKSLLNEASRSGFLNIQQLSPKQFSLSTNKVALSTVLKDFSKKSRIIIHDNDQDDLVTVNCTGDFVAVMYCLLGESYSVIVRHREPNQSMVVLPEIAEIWLVQKSDFELPKKQPKYPINESKTELIDNFLLMAKDPSQRTEAIAQLAVLASNNDVLVKNELKQALNDSDPEVRAQAIFGLGKYHQNDSLGYLRQALSDESLDVRLMALQQCSDFPELLEQALKDNEAAVRDIASMKLKTLNIQHNKK